MAWCSNKDIILLTPHISLTGRVLWHVTCVEEPQLWGLQLRSNGSGTTDVAVRRQKKDLYLEWPFSENQSNVQWKNCFWGDRDPVTTLRVTTRNRLKPKKHPLSARRFTTFAPDSTDRCFQCLDPDNPFLSKTKWIESGLHGPPCKKTSRGLCHLL